MSVFVNSISTMGDVRGSVCDTNAGDEDVEVVIVERSILAEGKASREEEATKGEQRCQYPALIMAIT
jgi:hypothetical protein